MKSEPCPCGGLLSFDPSALIMVPSAPLSGGRYVLRGAALILTPQERGAWLCNRCERCFAAREIWRAR